MGLFSSIKKVYTSVDKKVGGVLPGGVKPQSSSDSPPPSQTTTTTTTTIPQSKSSAIPQSKSSAIVTDFSSGESVITKSSSGGGTTQTYRSSPTGSTNQIGQEKALEIANRPGGAVSQVSQARSSGSTLKDAEIQPYQYTGQPSERYQRPLGSALVGAGRQALNVGIIRRRGLGAYNEGIVSQFDYVGKPKAYKKIGFNINPRNYVDPTLQDTTDQTYFEYGEKKKRELFWKAGLKYEGENVAVIPQRIAEDVIKDIKPTYQGRVDAGEPVEDVTRDFETQALSQYQTRLNKVKGGINEIQKFESKIYKHPARTALRNIKTGAEIAAVAAVTAFGGALATGIASIYLGVSTFKGAVDYAGSYKNLSPGQKIVGGAGLAAGAAATFSLANIANKRFYGEWRNIIYEDLEYQRNDWAEVVGREVIKSGDYSKFEVASFEVASFKKTGSGQSLTTQTLDVYETGSDRIGFYGKGQTTTRIFDPQTERIITTKTPFKTGGYVPDIVQGSLIVRKGGQALKGGQQVLIDNDFYSGVGSAIYRDQNKIRSYNFISASREQQNYYGIIGGKSPKKAAYGIYRGDIDATGKIYFDSGVDEGVRYIQTSGAKSSPQYFKNLYGVGAGAAAQTTLQSQSINLASLRSTAGKSASVGGSAVTGLKAVQSFSQLPTSAQIQLQQPRANYGLAAAQLPTSAQLGLQDQTSKSAAATGIRSFSASAFSQNQPSALLNIQAQPQSPALRFGSAQAPGLLIPNTPTKPGYFNPPTPSGFAFPLINLSPGGLGLSSKIVRGGQRVTSYTPSFSALFFKIRGAAGGGSFAKSGINFRPITPGFSFKTGLSGKSLRRLRF